MKIIRNFIELAARRKGAKNKNTIKIDLSKGRLNNRTEQEPTAMNAPTSEIKTEFSVCVSKVK